MTPEQLQQDNDALRRRLEEAEETIHAIRSGAVDALVVASPDGHRIYTLESADRPYRLLVEQMQQGAVTLFADGMIAYCNRRFAEWIDRPLERVIGTLFRDLLPPEAADGFEELLRAGCAGAGQGESQLRTAGGGLMPVFLTFNALPPDSGAAVGVLVTDLTSQRYHEKLNAAMETLKDSDRRKNEFLAMLAHELRNPLAPVVNALQIMRLTNQSTDADRSATEMMERQIGQMVRLVEDLLDVSRTSRGKIELRRGRIELASAINHAVEAARSLVQCMEHDLIVTLPTEPLYLDADPIRLAQVVGNLLNNACKFTKKGGRIELIVEREDQEIVIRVRDNGIGIGPDQLPRIFEMFTQIDTSLERTVSGLGIGLTLVKTLIEMHGGTVAAQSAGIGHGSEFVVRVPLASVVESTTFVVGAAEEVRTPGKTPPNASRRILVVDDNRDSAATLAMLLKLSGHETRTAHDGLAAVDEAASFRPEVILMDIGLPKLNGYEAGRQIREQTWGKSIFLVALTGWGQEDDRQKSREAGFNSHLVKPVDFDSLRKLLNELPRTN